MIRFEEKYDVKPRDNDLSIEQVKDCYKVIAPVDNLITFEKLNGGFSNLTYLVKDSKGIKSVFRLSSTSKSEFENEVAIILSVKENGISCPNLLQSAYGVQVGNQTFGLMLVNFEDGVLLNHAITEISKSDSHQNRSKEYRELGEGVGNVLAKIHSIKYRESDHLSKTIRTDLIGKSYFEYILESLDSLRVSERLSEPLRKKCKEWIISHQNLFSEADQWTCLMHNDFNLKNILVKRNHSKWEISCVLDWEFAEIGTPFVDLGNFLRFEDELPNEFLDSFKTKYIENVPEMPENWRLIAKCFDLASMMHFLQRDGNLEKTFRTANQVVEKTVF